MPLLKIFYIIMQVPFDQNFLLFTIISADFLFPKTVFDFKISFSIQKPCQFGDTPPNLEITSLHVKPIFPHQNKFPRSSVSANDIKRWMSRDTLHLPVHWSNFSPPSPHFLYEGKREKGGGVNFKTYYETKEILQRSTTRKDVKTTQ